MQQLSPRHLVDPMFASLRRWTAKTPFPSEIPPEITIASMDAGNVAVGLSAAWCGPHGWMISHEEVAAVASAYPERILGVASAHDDGRHGLPVRKKIWCNRGFYPTAHLGD